VGDVPGVSAARVEEVLAEVDLADDADRKVRTFSTGMRQRLGLACALLTEPDLLVLDEPANGLDPDGIRWLRDTLRRTAGQGRSVLLCSHLLSDVEQTVDDVVILQQGGLVYSGTLDDLTAGGTHRLEDRFFSIADAGGTSLV
jgi:ABC-2 type transport system ATP-binding protein